MEEPERRQLLERALPLLAIVLMTSGIVVRTVPLESKRPADPEHAKFSHAGLQDVEARLWEDPFGAIRHIKGSTPVERCKEALEDKLHHPYVLSELIRRGSKLAKITVLPVLLQGGPYFENGESRRRARYAVVTALLNAGWEPNDEEKLGYVWTFENCVEDPWARRIPELLPYEGFVKRPEERSREPDAETPRFQGLLILWVDEDAVSRAPLRGFEQLAELLARPETLCSPDETEGDPWLAPFARARRELAWKLRKKKACLASDEPYKELPWHDMRVIGPSTSTPLPNMIRELARRLVRDPGSARLDGDPPPPRFYSATATAELSEDVFSRALERAKSQYRVPGHTASPEATPDEIKALENQIVRLTATDEKLVDAFVKELTLRLGDQAPWQRLVAWWKDRPMLCDDTIVIVGEGDTPYARSFRQAFSDLLQKRCDRDDTVEQVSYLRGLDGVLPTGPGVPAPPAPRQTASDRTDTRAGPIRDILPDQATLEHADGRSQYDYLRRLGERLIDLDRRKRQEGARGVTAIGVLGNDTYDKLLVLDALREHFPRAVFFAADLDARLLGRGARQSTRNLVVASAYGLKLHPNLQGTAPPFRDTYQTGIYLATRVAIDSDAQDLPTDKFHKWFAKPRLFEIGRTRAVPLWQVRTGESEACQQRDPRQCNTSQTQVVALSRAGARPCDRPNPQRCTNIHPADEWRGFDPLPDRLVAAAVAVMVLTATALGLLLSDRANAAVRHALTWLNDKPSRWGVLAGVLVPGLGLFGAGLWRIQDDVASATGEPFAWLEGVSIWPTQIFQMLLLILTGTLLVGGRVWFRRKIDGVANKFGVETLSKRENNHSPQQQSEMWTLLTRRWDLVNRPQAKMVEGKIATGLWGEFLDRMRFKPSATRVVCTTVLFFLFGLALLILDWPSSPHRGILGAWSNHALQVLLLASMTALLVSALDASMMATRLLRARLDQYDDVPQHRDVPRWSELVRYTLVEQDPAVDHVQCAAEVTTAVNRLIYLPFLTFLLLVPMRSRVFDTWVLPLPYVALILLAVGVALLHTIALRRAAAGRRAEVLADIDQKAARYELQAKLAQEGVPDARDEGSEPPISAKADLLKSRADRLRSLREGPFRPLDQEPVVRALLLLLGGTGTLTIVEFLFLGQG